MSHLQVKSRRELDENLFTDTRIKAAYREQCVDQITRFIETTISGKIGDKSAETGRLIKKQIRRIDSMKLSSFVKAPLKLAALFGKYIMRRETGASRMLNAGEKLMALKGKLSEISRFNDEFDSRQFRYYAKAFEGGDNALTVSWVSMFHNTAPKFKEDLRSLKPLKNLLTAKRAVDAAEMLTLFNKIPETVKELIVAVCKDSGCDISSEATLIQAICNNTQLKGKIGKLVNHISDSLNRKLKLFKELSGSVGSALKTKISDETIAPFYRTVMDDVANIAFKRVLQTNRYIYDTTIEAVCPDLKGVELEPQRIAMVCPEYRGLAHQGGLGEAVKGLSRGLASKEGGENQIQLIFPEYSNLPQDIKDKLNLVEPEELKTGDGETFTVKTIEIEPGVRGTFIRHPLFILKGDKPSVYGPDFLTVGQRFAKFSNLAADYLHANRKNVDMIHLHDAHVAGCALKLKRYYKDEWKSGEIPPIVFTFHNNSESAQNRTVLGPYNYAPVIDEFRRTGILKQNENFFVKLLDICDVATTVSEKFSLESQQRIMGKGVSFQVKRAAKAGKLLGITNGIDSQNWDPSTDASLANFRVTETSKAVDLRYDRPGFTLYDQRQKAKEQLALWVKNYSKKLPCKTRNFDKLANIKKIWDPNKPTMSFIGRYDSTQKGIETLPDAIEAALNSGGQFICMGSSEDEASGKILDDLQKKYAHHNDVLIIRDYKTTSGKFRWQQELNCGSLIRAASDFVFIPSKFEPCGLVQFESWSFGSLVVGSAVGGLADTISEQFGYDEVSGTWSGNGLTFNRGETPGKSAKKAVKSVFESFRTLNKNRKNELMQHLIKEGKSFGWSKQDDVDSPANKYRSAYALAKQRVGLRGCSMGRMSDARNRRIKLLPEEAVLQQKKSAEEEYLKALHVKKLPRKELIAKYKKLDLKIMESVPNPFGRDINYERYKTHGAFVGETNYEFRLEAKKANHVKLKIYDENEKLVFEKPLKLGLDGLWYGSIDKNGLPGSGKLLYRYVVNGKVKIDPYSRMITPTPPDGGVPFSVLTDSDHKWADAEWIAKRDTDERASKPISVYELHPKTWLKNNGENCTYKELGEAIVKHQKEVGFTHVELMGICHHPNEKSWGYQVTGYFSPDSALGSPDDFKEMIDYLHQNNIGVLLDWVPNHFAHDEYALANFDGDNQFQETPKFSEAWWTIFWNKWGHLFNFDKKSVREFLISSAHFWISEMHIDGIRVDAVRCMLGRGTENAKLFMQEMNEVIHNTAAGVISIAEEYKGYRKMTHRVEKGGYGFDYKWHIAWSHHFLNVFSKPFDQRKEGYNELVQSISSDDFSRQMMAISHDHVAAHSKALIEKTPGLDVESKFRNLRNALSFMMCLPGKKLLFMGSEFGSEKAWNDLIGTQESILGNVNLEENTEAKKTCQMLAKLNKLYQDIPALNLKDGNSRHLEWVLSDDPNKKIVAYRRKEQIKDENDDPATIVEETGDSYVCLHNFTDEDGALFTIDPENLKNFEVIFRSDEPEAGNEGHSALFVKQDETNPNSPYCLKIPKNSTVIVKELNSQFDGKNPAGEVDNVKRVKINDGGIHFQSVVQDPVKDDKGTPVVPKKVEKLKNLARKIVGFTKKVFVKLKMIITFPARFLGSKTWSIPGIILRAPVYGVSQIYKRFISKATGELNKSKTSFFGKGYSFGKKHELERRGAKFLLPYASAAMAVKSGDTSWNKDSKFQQVSLKDLLCLPFPEDEFTLTDDFLTDNKTGVKISLHSKGKKILIAVGVASGENSVSTQEDRKNIAGLSPSSFERVAKIVKSIQDLSICENKQLELTGFSSGGTFASYAALKCGIKATCFSSIPFGVGLQDKLGEEALSSADEYLTHVCAKNDYWGDRRFLGTLDKVLNHLGIKTPGIFGKRYVIPSIFRDSRSSHNLFMQSLMSHLGYSAKSMPSAAYETQNIFQELQNHKALNGAERKKRVLKIVKSVVKYARCGDTAFAPLRRLFEEKPLSLTDHLVLIPILETLKQEIVAIDPNQIGAINMIMAEVKEKIFVQLHQAKNPLVFRPTLFLSIERIKGVLGEFAESKELYNLKSELKYLINNPDPIVSFTKSPFEKITDIVDVREPVSVDSRPVEVKEKPTVLHAAFEYKECTVGGLGTVTGDLIPRQQAYGHDARIITPYYSFLHKKFDAPKFITCVKHQYNGKIVDSAIYRIENGKDQNGKPIKNYLVKPLNENRLLFDVGESVVDLYKNYDHSTEEMRSLYFSSAVAAFAGGYKGRKQSKSIDVLNAHEWHSGLSLKLIKDVYNPARENRGLSKTATVSHRHLLSFAQGVVRSDRLRKIGLKPKDWLFTAVSKATMDNSDKVVFVSKAAAKLSAVKNQGYGLRSASKKMLESGALLGITNGIETNQYDFTNPSVFGEYAMDSTSKENGYVNADIIAAKQRCKEILAEKGIISDPSKPLFMFVGRYSSEKGTDMLEGMVKEVNALGGQSLVMGVKTSSPLACRDVERLVEFSKNKDSNLKVYTELQQQLNSLEGTNIQIGKLIRFAADFTLVPSHLEACGLVPMEAMSLGSLIVTSNVQGLKDNCIGLDTHTADSFNSFTYSDSPWSRKAGSKDAVRRAISYYNETSKEERNKVLRRVVNESSKFDWNSPEGTLEQYHLAYQSVINK